MTETAAASRWRVLLEEEYRHRLSYWSDIQGQMPLLYSAALVRARPVIAELGTRSGQSTCALLAGAAVTGGHVHSVDPGPLEHGAGSVPGWWAKTGLWSFLPADDMSDAAAAWVPAVLDVLFVDTSHTYDHTLAELRRYAPRVRPGGVVLCHDVELRCDDPVMGGEWVDANMDGPEYPVAAALDTWCAETGLAWERQAAPEQAPGPQPGWDVQFAAALHGNEQPFYGLGSVRIPGP